MWRRQLGELTDGGRGLDDLRALVRAFTDGDAALAPA